MKGFADKMTDNHQVSANTTNMGLQAHPCSNKRTMEGLVEEPASRAAQHHYNQQQTGPRAAKQQCTIRVGLEAPEHLGTPVNWYRDQPPPQQQQQAPDYETYVNGFNAAQVRASTPYSAAATNNTTTYYTASTAAENVPVPAVEYSSYSSSSSNAGEVYSSQNVYQNLTSMLPVANGGGESLADRFERVCSSPRPYVQYGREEANGYHYGGNGETGNERYWTFGYTSHCPKKTRNNNYGYQQTIQRDENGKSYLELGGAKAAVEWVRPAQPTQQQHYVGAPVKSCSKCGHVLPSTRSQPCYRHQRLSVLSLSMLKLNRYRQCSDPSLHRSVLICNTLRHIEDEMEREGLVCNPSTETSSANCDTCCCSHCGTVFNTAPKQDNTPPPPPTNNNNNNTVYGDSAEANFANVANADEDDSGFGDEDSRDIDWSSVFSMSTTSGFDVSSSSSSDSYLCDSNSSDPSLFAGAGPELVNESGPNWKSSGSSGGGGSSWTSDASDFSGVRWKTELGDELEGFVHILVGS